MALTGIQILKLLPKTNCKECGVPTCLAFAMNLASGKAELDSCPYVSDEAREKLSEASAPPIRPVAIGKGVRAATTGGETVQYRHEKTFYNPTLLAAAVGWRAFARKQVIALWVLLALHILIYVCIMIVSLWEPQRLINTSLDRILLHTTPAALFLMVFHWSERGKGKSAEETGL